MMNRMRLGVGVAGLVACGGARLDPVPVVTWPKSTAVSKVLKSELDMEEQSCVQPNICPKASCIPSETICPNGTTNCCQPNGNGIYTDQGGSAAIGEIGLMITHFINRDFGVEFDGRYYDSSLSGWATLTGRVVSADYLKTNEPEQLNLRVVSVSESNTRPTWTLADSANQSLAVDGPNLQFLKLHIVAPGSLARPRYVLSFEVEEIRKGTGNAYDKLQYYAYKVLWNSDPPGPSPQPYCLDGGQRHADGTPQPDAVVFQQGIDVSPLSGLVARSTNTEPTIVTMSCSLGAPAMVYAWGYTYHGTYGETVRFDAGIHAKRASYCGNSQFHTNTNLFIDVADDGGVGQSKLYIAAPHREAVWTPRGAICLESSRMRNEVIPKLEAPFTCPAGSAAEQLQACPHQPPPDPYVVTGLP